MPKLEDAKADADEDGEGDEAESAEDDDLGAEDLLNDTQEEEELEKTWQKAERERAMAAHAGGPMYLKSGVIDYVSLRSKTVHLTALDSFLKTGSIVHQATGGQVAFGTTERSLALLESSLAFCRAL